MNAKYIKAINKSGIKMFCAITGGGQSFIGDYLRVSGGSKVLVGAIIPYQKSVFDEFAQCSLTNYCNVAAARKLAVAAYNKAVEHSPNESKCPNKVLGIGVSCSLASDNEREDREHRINIAIHTVGFTVAIEYKLEQGRTRDKEETLAANLILRFLARTVLNHSEACGKGLFDDETYLFHSGTGTDYLPLFTRQSDIVSLSPRDCKNLIVFPGSFNPIHDGHRKIIELATSILGEEPVLEISVKNADKPQLDYIDLNNRVAGLHKKSILLTHAPTFVDKINVLRKTYPDKPIIFVIGADTWTRLWNPKYGYHPEKLADIIKENNVKFLVFPREGYHISNQYDDLRIRADLKDFKQDISSTKIRNESNA